MWSKIENIWQICSDQFLFCFSVSEENKMIKNSIVSQGGVRREEEIQVRWNKTWNLLTTCFQCQEKIISSSSSSPVKSLTPILARFRESELLLLHRLVHQECDEGVLSEKKIRNIYADIFPVVFNIFFLNQFFLCDFQRHMLKIHN